MKKRIKLSICVKKHTLGIFCLLYALLLSTSLAAQTQIEEPPQIEQPKPTAPSQESKPLLEELTLQDIIFHTYLSNPTIQASRDQLKSVDEEYALAIAGFKPSLSGSANRVKGHTRDISKDPSTGRTHSKTNSDSIGAEARQPIFNGGKTLASVKSANNQIKAAREELRSSEQDILLAAVTAYADVVRDRSILKFNQNNVKVLEKQKEATQSRFEVGLVTRTDISIAEARLARGVSDRTQAEGNLKISQAIFLQIIGFEPYGELSFKDENYELPNQIDDAISVSLDKAPGLLKAKYLEEAAKADVWVSRSDLFPEVSIKGNTNRAYNPPAGGLKRSDNSSISAEVSVPLYQSGSTTAKIRQSKQIAKKRFNEIEEARRLSIEKATEAWANYQAAQATINSSQKESESLSLVLDGIRQEVEVGSKSILDLLDSEQEYLDALVRNVSAQHDTIIAKYNLFSAMGTLHETVLTGHVELFDSEEYYNKLKYKFW